MSTSLSFFLNEKFSMLDDIRLIFRRRRQLHPMPFESHEIIDVIYNPEQAVLVRQMINAVPEALHWSNGAILDAGLGDNFYVDFHCEHKLPITGGFLSDKTLKVADTPAGAKMVEWARSALLEETKVAWAMHTIEMVIGEATTHQQVHRYMPELYTLYENQADRADMAPYRKARILAVARQLKQSGSARAKRLELTLSGETRRDLKTYITSTLVLPVSLGLGGTSPFSRSWIVRLNR